MQSDYSKVGQLPTVTGPVAPAATAPNANPAQTALYAEVSRQLGSNWFNRQQAAAAAGDWDTYNSIQAQVNAILNPPNPTANIQF
jgi:hypothetical protein